MALLTHHFWTHKTQSKKKRSKQLQRFDNTVFILSFIYPLSGIPQALAVWHGDGKASVVTWIMLFSFGCISLTYALIHRIKPMIVTNIIWSFIDVAIIIGILRH